MLHTAVLSCHVSRSHVRVISHLASQIVDQAILCAKFELYLDQPGSKERPIARTNVH
jgi:hypothetical protein